MAICMFCGEEFDEDDTVERLASIGAEFIWPVHHKMCPDCAEDEVENASGGSSVPSGCRACGGDYPNCKDSCSMFD